MARSDEDHEVRCCSDTPKPGWKKKNNCNVWAASKVPVCFDGETYEGAKIICELEDARLCTAKELQDRCTRGTGCMHDEDLIWSSFTTPYIPNQTNGSHLLACGNSGKDCDAETQVADDDTFHEVRCCSDTLIAGWKKKNNCEVWAQSELPICFHKETYAGAESICAQNNARLCTVQEMLRDCTTGTGCGHDPDMIWTSTPAPPVASPTPVPAPVPEVKCCPDDFSGLRAYDSCTKFFHCLNGVVYGETPQPCPQGTLFDNNIQNCNWDSQVECGGPDNCPSLAPTPTPPPPPDNEEMCCPPGYTGLRPFDSCAKFYHCVNGVVTGSAIPCGAETLFDENIQNCNWASAVQCNYSHCPSTVE